MTDRDFVNILRHCDTLDCPYCTEDMSSDAVADRVERLLNENDLLYREVAKLKAECDHFRDLTKKLWCEKRYAGTLNSRNKNMWQNKTECTDEAICAVRDYMVSDLLGGFECKKGTESGYAWDLKDGRTVTLKISVSGTQPQREDV